MRVGAAGLAKSREYSLRYVRLVITNDLRYLHS